MMQTAIGRNVGRGRGSLRPGCQLISGRSHQFNATPNSAARRFESNLNLPALDREWRTHWLALKIMKESPRSRYGKKKVHQNGRKMYILPMFPYPSGDLHLGHLRVYTISDVLARFRRMQGYDVIHPIGWDAFGLPAENAAIERGIDPASWTKLNIKKMGSQLVAMNGQWDWDKEFSTCDPSFYKHTQRLFLLLHQRGLAYQAESLVNYDPVDKTVLANEQVDANGNSWRSGAKVEKKMLKQWFLKISEFRQALLDDLKQLEKNGAWPERVLAMQKNWLGKSTGARIKFPVVAYDQQTHSDIEVFTTRPDTLFGVQYLALASIHPIVQNLAKTDVELQAFLDTIPALPTDSKVGYLLPHVRAQNPLAAENSTPDATKASLPLYVAPYVLGDYGDGAVMGVPGHDVRDHAFWKHNRYDDPVRVVVSQSPDGSTTALRNKPFVHVGYLTHHSGPYARMTTEQATKEIIALLESKGLGSAAETWRLRDWLVSRQRYWGTPIPIIHCDGCGPVPVPKDQLPVELPSVDEHWMEGKTGNPLDHAHDWVNTTCPKCGGAAKRETDTMDTFVDSSWYFMRFLDSHNDKLPLSPEAANSNLPVDVYIGGVEHAILHLLYARFISKFLATTPLWPEGSKSHGEPFKRILTQGMVHGKTYSDPANGRFLKPAEVDISNPSKPIVLATGSVANVSFEKMSKSKYNGVDPSTCMEKYGADATRAHILFQAPVSEVLEWDEEKISGVIRWLRRLYDFIHVNHQTWIFMDPFFTFNPKNHLIQLEDYMQNAGNAPPGINRLDLRKAVAKISASDKALWRSVQGTIANVTASYGNTYSLNTVVSDLMTLTNVILEHAQLLERINYTPPSSKNRPMEATAKPSPQLMRLAIMELLKMMAPITPAFAEECWAKTGGKKMETVPMLSKLASYFGRSVFRGSRERSISIFDEPFPTEDGTFDMLASDTQTCAVQINGKFRFAVKIPFPPTGLKGKALESWIKQEILETKEGATRLTGRMEKGKKHVDIRNATKVIVVGGGRTVNFVVLL